MRMSTVQGCFDADKLLYSHQIYFAVSYTPPHVARDSLGTPYNPWRLPGDSLETP